MKRIFFLAVICLCAVVFLGCATAQRGAMSLAHSRISKGEYERALKELSYAEGYKEPTPDLKAEILYLRAICYEGLGRYDDAIGALKYLIDKFPDSSYAYQAKERLRGIPPQTPTATIVNFGIYEVVESGRKYEHKESTAGYAEEGVKVTLVKKTTDIPLKKGVIFGIEWEAQGLPDIPIKIAMRVKHPQTTKPDGTVSTGFDEMLPFSPKKGRIKKRGDYYGLSEDWEMLPGEWSLSMVYEGKVLCEEVFRVIAP